LSLYEYVNESPETRVSIRLLPAGHCKGSGSVVTVTGIVVIGTEGTGIVVARAVLFPGFCSAGWDPEHPAPSNIAIIRMHKEIAARTVFHRFSGKFGRAVMLQ
jgi:hypothetical protein